MQSTTSILHQHEVKNVALLALSLIFLPLDTIFVLAALIFNRVIPSSGDRRRDAAKQVPEFTPKTILVTGVGMSKGLCLARQFYEAGHNVIGVDFESDGALVCGRISKSLTKFYRLQRPIPRLESAPYVESLLDIVLRESVDLWVSCSGVASAIEDGEAKEIIQARTSCKAVQFDVKTTQMLHEKASFIEHTKTLGLNVPETYTVTTLEAAKAVLRKAPQDRRYIMKPVGMDDANRGDMTLLPKSTLKETTEHLSKLKISEQSSWIIQQIVEGPEYCTHSLVVKGQVLAFVACPSVELLMHYEALPHESRLNHAMLKFTQIYASKGGPEFTGHLSFDFMVDQRRMNGFRRIREDEDPVLYPIECNPRAHTAVVLFNGTANLPNAYLSLLNQSIHLEAHESEKCSTETPMRPHRNHRYFWIGHDVVELLIQPLLSVLLFQPHSSVNQLIRNVQTFREHLCFWRDGTFERWDPLPFWWLYHVYWPMQFWNALTTGREWSRINVSTTKMFEC